MTDPLFPFPSPEFLFRHQVIIRRTSTEVEDSNNEGWADDDGAEKVPTRAYVTAPDFQDAGASQNVSAVILVPRTLAVDFADEVTIEAQPGLHNAFVGDFEIEQVRPNPSHTRLLIRRPDLAAPSY